jgi:hypothetical protein
MQMTMPGFNADASLYRTESLYHAAGVPAMTANGVVNPALILGSPECLRQCNFGPAPCANFECLCRCQGGTYSHAGFRRGYSCGTCTFHL